MRNKILSIFVVLCCLFFGIYGVDNSFYADVVIDVDNTGAVSIDGTTNYDSFKNITDSQEYTFKERDFWLLNISTDEVFDSYVYELNLPQGSKINYIKTTPNFKIEEDNNRIKLVGVGENKTFQLIVQYKIEKKIFNNNGDNRLLFLGLGLFVALVLVFLMLTLVFYSNIKKTKKALEEDKKRYEEKNEKKELEDKEVFDIDVFTERQKEILRMLQENKKMTQKEIEDKMQIPKSSVSRNIQSLYVKGIVKKMRIAQTNYISLNEKIELRE